MPSLACPICQHALTSPAQTDFASGPPIDWHRCSICGHFGLEASATSLVAGVTAADPEKRGVLRYHIAKITANNKLPVITRQLVERLLAEGTLPEVSEQADNLVRWLGRNAPGPGEGLDLSWDRHGPTIGSRSSEGFLFVIKGLNRLGLIDGPVSHSGFASLHLTFAGWERFHAMERTAVESRTGFMAMKFGRPITDRLFRDFLKPAVALTGFELRRMDDRPKAGLIDQRMEVEIRTSRFLIAELTHGNRGAYWEAGFASGLGKPVFYLCEASKFRRASTHFDTNHHFTIQWSVSDMRAAADALKDAIRATLPAEAKLTDT